MDLEPIPGWRAPPAKTAASGGQPWPAPPRLPPVVNIGRPRPVGIDGLTLARPRRHRHTDRCEWLAAGIAELERRADWDCERDPGSKIDLPSLASVLVARHPSQTLRDVPDLADGPVPLWAGTSPAPSSKWAILPDGSLARTRTSDPSGATASCCVGRSGSVKTGFSCACVMPASLRRTLGAEPLRSRRGS